MASFTSQHIFSMGCIYTYIYTHTHQALMVASQRVWHRCVMTDTLKSHNHSEWEVVLLVIDCFTRITKPHRWHHFVLQDVLQRPFGCLSLWRHIHGMGAGVTTKMTKPITTVHKVQHAATCKACPIACKLKPSHQLLSCIHIRYYNSIPLKTHETISKFQAV